jgi:hypothetical protein
MQMRKKETNLAVLAARGNGVAAAIDSVPADASSAAHLGTLLALQEDGTLLVQLAGTTAPVAARLAIALTATRLQAAIHSLQPAVLLFENGDRSRPIVIGLLEAPPRADAANDAEATPVIEADVDGKRVRITAKDEIVLQCGPASITLRRNGRVVIRGVYVETHSDGTNRIKGGQVQIN